MKDGVGMVFPTITMTSSQAQSYCLTIAQIIPVFLLALFVVNSPYAKIQKKLLRKHKEVSKEARKLLAEIPKRERELIRGIVRTDSMLLSLDIDKDLWKGKETAARRMDLTRVKLDAETAYREYAKSSRSLEGQLDSSRITVKKGYQEAARAFKQSVIISIALGVVGEVVSLWSASGIIGIRFGIAFTTNITITLLAFLSGIAIVRFTAIGNSRRSKILLIVWPTLITGLAFFGYIDLIARLKIKG